jgi:cellulose biosynthesis protein BcsQ
MAHIYAIANQKGGVGKTTTVVNLSGYLAGSGRRVLVVDLDAQANATSALGFAKNQMQPSTYELLLDQLPVSDVRRHHDEFHLDLLPSSPSLAAAEIELVHAIGREYRLRKALEEIESEYDYILIDSPSQPRTLDDQRFNRRARRRIDSGSMRISPAGGSDPTDRDHSPGSGISQSFAKNSRSHDDHV